MEALTRLHARRADRCAGNQRRSPKGGGGGRKEGKKTFYDRDRTLFIFSSSILFSRKKKGGGRRGGGDKDGLNIGFLASIEGKDHCIQTVAKTPLYKEKGDRSGDNLLKRITTILVSPGRASQLELERPASRGERKGGGGGSAQNVPADLSIDPTLSSAGVCLIGKEGGSTEEARRMRLLRPNRIAVKEGGNPASKPTHLTTRCSGALVYGSRFRSGGKKGGEGKGIGRYGTRLIGRLPPRPELFLRLRGKKGKKTADH